MEFDFVVIGAGSAGCAVAAGLAKANIGSVAVLEAGPSDAVPQVKVPFGLLYTMGSGRDWRFKSTAQHRAANRQVNVNRGYMLGGSSSINSMVWFRGRADDFDNWRQPGWSWSDVEPEFEEIERLIKPRQPPSPHPLSIAFAKSMRANSEAPPTPERESAGIFDINSRNGRRWSAADAFLRPAERLHGLQVVTGANVDRIECHNNVAKRIHLIDGSVITARGGIVLSAGSIGSPAILMRSGIGPGAALSDLGIQVTVDAPRVGKSLCDHPSVGVHHAGKNSGYGLVWNQSLHWAMSPFEWLLKRQGRLTSNFVEAGAFFRAAPVTNDDDAPDCQVHFIPFMLGYRQRKITTGAGYFADVCVCRPKSRGSLTLASADPRVPPNIDLGLLREEQDVNTLVAGIKLLRTLLASAPVGEHQAREVYPASSVTTDEQLAEYVRNRCGTAYHPVGTLAIGGKEQPVSPGLSLHGVDSLWVADASVMPSITSANTNAPTMMIGHKAAKLIARKIRDK